MSEANDQIIVISDDLQSKSQEEQESLSIEQVQSSSSGKAPAAEVDDEMEEADEVAENNNYQLMVIPEQDREYGCRYCDKKFTNKQALGGHQNAHKVERLMEKNDQDTSAAGMGFFLTHSPYHGRMAMAAAAAYHRHPNFLHRAPLYNWNCGRPPPHACIYHQQWSSAPMLPPAPPVRPHYVNIQLPNFGPGSSNTFRPGFDRQGFPEVPPGFAPLPRVINLRNVPEEANESGLDLSLRLGYDDGDGDGDGDDDDNDADHA